MKFKLGCQLDYNISSDSTFIFNICAVENKYQHILHQSLEIKPDCKLEEYRDRHSNSYFRLNVPQGKLKPNYQAEVELTHHTNRIDEIVETPPANLPLDVVPYLYPSRYCQSDRLMKLAQDRIC